MNERLALYFGYGDGGHFLRAPGGGHRDSDYPGFPWAIGLLDTGLLENAGVLDRPDGRVFATCGGAPLWIAFVWWDRSGDARGASNSGFYVRGFEWAERASAWAFACETWPKVVARQKHPLVLQEGRP